MKPSSPALRTLLASRQFFVANLYTFTLIGGGVLRYCSGDADITANGHLYPAGGQVGPFFDSASNRAKAHWKLGVEVDTLTFDVLPGTSTVLGQPFLAACITGAFDGAELTLERAFMPTYGNTSAGTVILFVGRVAEVDIGRSMATFSVNSHLELLNLNLPRNLYQAGCTNTLGDASCTVNLAGLGITGAAAAGSSSSVIRATIAQASGYFDQGKIQFTSGSNAGLWRSVKSWVSGSPGTLSLLAPFPTAPSFGDTFTVYPGCDKTQTTCSGKFGNLANFRGFPYVPIPETAV
jgi:uncharacterized phage protein (TIGR02218 family)